MARLGNHVQVSRSVRFGQKETPIVSVLPSVTIEIAVFPVKRSAVSATRGFSDSGEIPVACSLANDLQDNYILPCQTHALHEE
jgi:hypothetical protein